MSGDDEFRERLARNLEEQKPVLDLMQTRDESIVARHQRWAAFTEAELRAIDTAFFIANAHESERTGTPLAPACELWIEVLAELEERRDEALDD
jgi:hypothetical protein